MPSQPDKSLGRNDICWCGSRLKYKHCHLDIDSCTGPARVNAARKVYLRSWERNAENFEKQAAYDWMAARLLPYKPKRIFDIGCGDGRGLAALWRTHSIDLLLSVDENRECLCAAEKQFIKLGLNPVVVPRLNVKMVSDKIHCLAIDHGCLLQRNGIVLIESDILADNEIEEFLVESQPFDAVTIWMMGTHLMRQNCNSIIDSNLRTSTDYRLRVQNIAYELAEKILRPGGVLQIVDRGQEPDNQSIRDEIIAGHTEQASVTSLQVCSLEYIPYTEISTLNRVSMVPSSSKFNEVREIPKIALISITSVKPL